MSDSDSTSENVSSGYLPETGVEDGTFFESAGLSAMGLALLGSIAVKKKKTKNKD
ncbi:LPXTG cell wall anchor domain-containing protein [Lactococcus lactis]|uniref:LPXTG cell wall anchor domain-containing protein n=1 Tax=Lactococcus lactis TaxID=1358 RepID=UPI00352986DF